MEQAHADREESPEAEAVEKAAKEVLVRAADKAKAKAARVRGRVKAKAAEARGMLVAGGTRSDLHKEI